MKIRVYGKINLSLNVLTKEIDGYHQLDMVNQSVSVFDEIELAPRVDKLCRVKCDKDIGVINTALTSASAFVKRFGTNGYDIFIKKGIPMKGGSAAAALTPPASSPPCRKYTASTQCRRAKSLTRWAAT